MPYYVGYEYIVGAIIIYILSTNWIGYQGVFFIPRKQEIVTFTGELQILFTAVDISRLLIQVKKKASEWKESVTQKVSTTMTSSIRNFKTINTVYMYIV